MIRRSLAISESVSVVPGFLDFTHVRNTGAAYGMLDTINFPFKTFLVGVVAAAALAGVVIYSRTITHGQRLARIGLALIIGGAAGNLVDRLVLGSVVDFVDVYWSSHHFWVFNVADSAISVGVTLMILDMLWTSTHVSKTV
jgi:signal peptidase II